MVIKHSEFVVTALVKLATTLPDRPVPGGRAKISD